MGRGTCSWLVAGLRSLAGSAWLAALSNFLRERGGGPFVAGTRALVVPADRLEQATLIERSIRTHTQETIPELWPSVLASPSGDIGAAANRRERRGAPHLRVIDGGLSGKIPPAQSVRDRGVLTHFGQDRHARWVDRPRRPPQSSL